MQRLRAVAFLTTCPWLVFLICPVPHSECRHCSSVQYEVIKMTKMSLSSPDKKHCPVYSHLLFKCFLHHCITSITNSCGMPVSVISINVQSVHLNNVTFVINTQFWNTVPLFANYTTCDMQPIEPLPPHNSDTEAKTNFCRTV